MRINKFRMIKIIDKYNLFKRVFFEHKFALKMLID